MSVPDLHALYPGLLSSQSRIVHYLHKLQHNRPNVLFLEGGALRERAGLALYWASLLNCRAQQPPCLQCASCIQIANLAYRDLFFFNGQEQSIKIHEVREARTIMGQKPDAGQVRVFVLHQAQELTQAAANSLLKAMEEPLPDNCFVLLATQRQLLLPTLVSRSFVLTLSRRSETPGPVVKDVGQWLDLLLVFWRTGQGLLAKTAAKGALDKDLVLQILLQCEKSLLQAAQNQSGDQLVHYWNSSLDLAGWNRVSELLQQAQEALEYQVHPALVLEWVALKIRSWNQEPGLLSAAQGMQGKS